MTVRDIDRGWKNIRKLATLGPVVDVGFLGVKGSALHRQSRQSIAQIASYHEYGTKHIPKRSMIFKWVEQRKKQIVDASVLIAGQIVEKRISARQGIGKLGAFAQGDIQARMSEGIPPPLSEVTIKRKGSSTPLIDTGQMRASVSYRVIR